jgi:hypothetical protein
MKPSEYPSTGRDWEARQLSDFHYSPSRRARETDYPINDDTRRSGSPTQRRGRRDRAVRGASRASIVGLPRARTGRRGGRLEASLHHIAYHYVGEHWLATFAALALEAQSGASPGSDRRFKRTPDQSTSSPGRSRAATARFR